MKVTIFLLLQAISVKKSASGLSMNTNSARRTGLEILTKNPQPESIPLALAWLKSCSPAPAGILPLVDHWGRVIVL